MEEIRRSPVEVGSLSHYLQGFIHPRWCRISSINSMVSQFFQLDHWVEQWVKCINEGVFCLELVRPITDTFPYLICIHVFFSYFVLQAWPYMNLDEL